MERTFNEVEFKLRCHACESHSSVSIQALTAPKTFFCDSEEEFATSDLETVGGDEVTHPSSSMGVSGANRLADQGCAKAAFGLEAEEKSEVQLTQIVRVFD